MFKNLTNFSLKRSFKEALGFYLAYLILAILVSTVSAAILGIILSIEKDSAYAFGIKIGMVSSILFSLILSVVLLKQKRLNNFIHLLFPLVSAVLALLGGGLLGLIVPAYLSTKDVTKK